MAYPLARAARTIDKLKAEFIRLSLKRIQAWAETNLTTVDMCSDRIDNILLEAVRVDPSLRWHD
jgi:hypothetical protein